MTLLEVLVKELPNRGGWPVDRGQTHCWLSNDNYITFYNDMKQNAFSVSGYTFTPDQYKLNITKEEYELALSNSQ